MQVDGGQYIYVFLSRETNMFTKDPKDTRDFFPLPPIIMEVKHGMGPSNSSYHSIFINFPLNHDYGRKSILRLQRHKSYTNITTAFNSPVIPG